MFYKLPSLGFQGNICNEEVVHQAFGVHKMGTEKKSKNFFHGSGSHGSFFPSLFQFSLLEYCKQNILILYEGKKIQSLKTYPFRGHGSAFESKTCCTGQ